MKTSNAVVVSACQPAEGYRAIQDRACTATAATLLLRKLDDFEKCPPYS